MVEFLLTDLGLGLAMLDSHNLRKNPVDRKRLIENVKVVLKTVARFESRISNPAVAGEIRRHADHLQGRLTEIEGTVLH